MSDFSELIPCETLESMFGLVKASACFAEVPRWNLASAYERPTNLGRYSFAALQKPLDLKTLCTHRSLAVNRLLFNTYEQNSLFLPPTQLTEEAQKAFQDYYAPSLVATTAFLRPRVEQACFSFLDSEIEVEGPWTADSFADYAQERVAQYERTASVTCERVEKAAHPNLAARLFLLQVAPDFLSEASQMARALPGNFGVLHSELTKIFIDEFGYGVHPTKHSTLFERTLESVGLASGIHAHYYWYLPTSLLLTSYFHLLTSNKQRWFEYLGALYWIEAVVPHFNRQFSRLLKRQFGPDVNTQYFDEHVGIDMHHRRMVLDRLIRPMVATYGEQILPAMVRGLEASRLLGDVAEQDFLEQMDFSEALLTERLPVTGADRVQAKSHAAGYFFEPQVEDDTFTFAVHSGRVEVDGGYLTPAVLEAGQAVRVPAGRLFGARVVEGEALVSRERKSAPPV